MAKVTAKKVTESRLISALSDESEDAAITISTTWEPIAGPGAPVKPAIYAGGKYQFGERWWPAGGELERVRTVSLDNVPSQANRLEAALKEYREDLGLPEIVLDLSHIHTLPSHLPRKISSFDLPHRNADAYLRDAVLGKKRFMDTEIGAEVFSSSGDNPEGLLAWMPQAFLFGFWQSHLGKKRQQTKWARVWTSEMFGIEPAADPSALTRTLGTKGDPLNLSISTAISYDEADYTGWSLTEGKAKQQGTKASEALSNLGHGQVPFGDDSPPLAVSCREIHQLSTVSFAGLRRLAAPKETRALLVALGLAAHQLAFGRSVQLRSGCALRPVSAVWEWLGGDADEEVEPLSTDEAVSLVGSLGHAAAKAGSRVGPQWEPEPVELRPNAQLTKVITESWPLATGD